MKPFWPALMLMTLALAACGQPSTSAVPGSTVPSSTAPGATGPEATAPATTGTVTLSIPAPSRLSAQYVNPTKTTRLDVQIDGGAVTSYTLGSAQAPCTGGLCTVTLGGVGPGARTFTASTYGVRPSDGSTVMISQGSVTQTLSAGQNSTVALTLTPVGTGLTLTSAVKQYDSAARAFGNFKTFTALAGHSLPAYYDVQGTDSVGDRIPGTADVNAVLCSPDSNVVVTKVGGAASRNRYRVEMTAAGRATLNLKAGSDCAAGSVLASQALLGTAQITAPQRRAIMGGYQSAALKADGSVVSWGYKVIDWDASTLGLVGVVTLADNSSADHGMALKSDGTVAYWGYGGSNLTATPGSLSGIVALGSGYEHSAALLSNGTVRVWGSGTDSGAAAPAGLTDVVGLSSGRTHLLALKGDGTVVAWGSNDSGETTVPTGLTGVAAVAAGTAFSLALKEDGTVVAWGNNDSGQTTAPAGLTGVVAVAAGTYHALALKSDGTVVAWGDNSSGQTTVPAGLTGVVAVAAGTGTSLALRQDGSVVAWGAVAAPTDVTAPGSVSP